MKRILNSIIIVAFAAFAAVSCEEIPASVSVSPNNLTLSDITTAQVTITSNYEWSATSSDSWIKVSPATGLSGTNQLNITLDPQTSDTRSGSIIIKCREASATITITQVAKAASALSFTCQTKSVKVPKLTGSSLKAKIDWGDGTKEDYSIGKSHTYSDVKEHTVVITLEDETTVTFEKITGLSLIDLTTF